MWLVDDEEKFLTIEESFVLNESVEPKSITHGSNAPHFNDSKMKVVEGALATFFNFEELTYCVGVTNNGGVQFASSKVHTDRLSFYSDKRTESTVSVIRIFNHVIWLVLKIADLLGLKRLQFKAADPKLGSLYAKMINNKTLNVKLKQQHWEYDCTEKDSNGFSLHSYIRK